MLKSAILDCQTFVFSKLLPNWAQHGLDDSLGFSYESLNQDWTINPVGRIRLLTQCRQLYTFSHACLIDDQLDLQNNFQPKLKPLFNFILDRYYQEERWIFSLNDDLSVQNTDSDAYALAFVLLSFSFYYQASKDERAIEYIAKTHHFLFEKMTSSTGGFFETFPIHKEQTRRQNPHMHLLEGYIAAFEATQKNEYKSMITMLLSLVEKHFLDKKNKTLREFFTYDWQWHPELGHQVEPGHHFEWVWLIYKANQIIPNAKYTDLAQQLWLTATRHGIDNNGGIFNQIDGNTLLATDKEKRIWPITEYLKAITVMPIGLEEKALRLTQACEFMLQNYFLATGGWNEYLDQENTPKKSPLSGTTSYHIFLGITEVLTWFKLNNSHHELD
ncbi:AGE family epimerase/isomerase [Marinomonas posidonica]|uniref:N-acylglucosamine 2-epimerase n=1 Tax=Marinomonas posidonica (strain CECT 7376 / NCIMB 14433 / IVIA-Po-181) TaxID=491952 RepID=F6CS45_MARPP|nr:AGE family epimerase/isomerase [Marinomonas posidonica]AEF53832.1 N-acylglucosamine 2-epimerase [Marinomonas posidonica IVIA-Po-181]